MVRQRKRLLALCLLMLITMMYSLGGKQVSAEEKLIKADNNGVSTNEYNDSRPFHFVGEVFLLI